MLPDDCLQLIVGALDMGTLCTARLVCKALCTEASRLLDSLHMHAEYLREHPETTFIRFPKLSRVALEGIDEEDYTMLSALSFRDSITEMKIFLSSRANAHANPRPTMPLLPNLKALEVSAHGLAYNFLFPLALQRLDCSAVTLYDPAPVIRLTALTSLDITTAMTDGGTMGFEELTALSALQKLKITCNASLIPYLGGLSCLTYLLWEYSCLVDEPFDLGPLTRLRRLVHLELGSMDLGPENIRTIGEMTSISSLVLQFCGFPAVDASFGMPLSRLTNLVLDGFTDVSTLERINFAGLRGLTLDQDGALGSKDLAVIEQATGLTGLRLSYGRNPKLAIRSLGPARLCAALSSMSGLQSLDLMPGLVGGRSCFEAIGLLTGLTQLKWAGGYVTLADVTKVACLTKLHVLRLYPHEPSPHLPHALDWFLALANLPELRSLSLATIMGISSADMTDSIATLINAPRHSRGWPPLELYFMSPNEWGKTVPFVF